MKKLFIVLCLINIVSSCSRKIEFAANLDLVNIIDFGAIPNDEKDDSKAIQAAVNYAIKNLKSSHIYCPPGLYDLHQGIVVGDQNENGEYNFVTLTISGHVSSYTSNQKIGSTTVFKLRNPTFGIAFQTVRNSIIENIVFEGCAKYEGDKNKIYNYTIEDWTTKSNAISNPHSPSCAIVIDPFHRTVPKNDRYKYFDSMYSNSSKNGSSMVLIRGCAFFKHFIAIANNPSTEVQNGDNIRAEQCHVNSCHTFWSVGQTQSRGNSIDNVYALFLHTLISGKQIGNQIGTPPTISNLNLAGFCKRVFDLRTGFSGLNVYRSYFESIWSLGVSQTISTSFHQSQIKFYIPDNLIQASPYHLYSDNVVAFRDCSIEYFNNCNTPLPFLFRSKELIITGGQIEGGVVVSDGITNKGGDDLNKVQITGTFIKCLGKVAGKKATQKPTSKLNDEIVMGGEMLITTEEDIIINQSTTYNVANLETANILLRKNKNSAVITSAIKQAYKIGDNLFIDVPIKVSISESENINLYTYLGYVSNIDEKQITVSGIPFGTESGIKNIYKVSYPTIKLDEVQKTNSNKIQKYKKINSME